jgi:hypothetical protein
MVYYKSLEEAREAFGNEDPGRWGFSGLGVSA